MTLRELDDSALVTSKTQHFTLYKQTLLQKCSIRGHLTIATKFCIVSKHSCMLPVNCMLVISLAFTNFFFIKVFDLSHVKYHQKMSLKIKKVRVY